MTSLSYHLTEPLHCNLVRISEISQLNFLRSNNLFLIRFNYFNYSILYKSPTIIILFTNTLLPTILLVIIPNYTQLLSITLLSDTLNYSSYLLSTTLTILLLFILIILLSIILITLLSTTTLNHSQLLPITLRYSQLLQLL